jgi:RNA polymerase sigma factor (sigma-70 family)
MRIPWNIVTKNLSPDDARLPLEKKVQQKIAKFDRHLAQFPPDTVHLQIVLEKHPRKFFGNIPREFLRHVRRHILQDELAGDLPKDAVNPRDVLNEVARRAEAKADKGPTHGSWLTWFYRLIHQELERQRWRLKQEKGKQAKTSPGATKVTASQAPTADMIRDRDEVSPVEIAARRGVVAQLEQDMRNWPRPEREIFELYYVEGFDPEEIALVTHQPLKTVRENLESIQRRLRDEMLAQKALA